MHCLLPVGARVDVIFSRRPLDCGLVQKYHPHVKGPEAKKHDCERLQGSQTSQSITLQLAMRCSCSMYRVEKHS